MGNRTPNHTASGPHRRCNFDSMSFFSSDWDDEDEEDAPVVKKKTKKTKKQVDEAELEDDEDEDDEYFDVVAKSNDEFTCQSCFFILRSHLRSGDTDYCRDCA